MSGGEAEKEGPSAWAPATYAGDLEGVSDLWLQPGRALIIMVI